MNRPDASIVRNRRAAPAILATGLLVATFAATAQEEVAAVYHERTVDFTYRSALAIYSCNALRGRVASIMRAIGARDDVEVRTIDCQEPIAPNISSDNWKTSTNRVINPLADNAEQRVHVSVRAFMPTPATPEVLAQLKKEKSRRELVARVTGKPLAGLEPAEFPARRQSLVLSRKTIGIEAVECELLDQMSTTAFRKLDVKEVSRGFSCNRSQLSNIPPSLTVEALVPAAFGHAAQLPAPGDKDDTVTTPGAPEQRP